MLSERFLFLDRDGTINQDNGYVHLIKDFAFVDGVVQFLRIFKNAGFKFIIITNQAGVAKAKFSKIQSDIFSQLVVDKLKKEGIIVESVYSCYHHVEGTIKKYSVDCNCRKPKSGLFFQSEKQFFIDKSHSIMIGNKISDIKAGFGFGLKTGLLVGTDEPDNEVDRFKDNYVNSGKVYTGKNYNALLKTVYKEGKIQC